MTEENKKINIQEEMNRAKDAYTAFELLFHSGLMNDAVSRLYYFVLYHIRALLLTKGLEPKSHEGALRLLSLHFIKTGILDTTCSHLFSKLMKYREEADYNPSYVFKKEEVIEFQKEAQELSQKIKSYLKAIKSLSDNGA